MVGQGLSDAGQVRDADLPGQFIGIKRGQIPKRIGADPVDRQGMQHETSVISSLSGLCVLGCPGRVLGFRQGAIGRSAPEPSRKDSHD